MSSSAKDAFPCLITPRLQLRQARSEDIADLITVLGDPEVMRYYDVEPLAAPDELLPMLQRWRSRFQEGSGIRWAISLRNEGRVIGTCGLGYQPAHRKASLGYELAQAYWRQGYMSEAIEAVVEYAFEQRQLHRVEALVMPDNKPSIGLLLSLGFQREGRLRDYYYFRGQYHDLLSFSLLTSDRSSRR